MWCSNCGSDKHLAGRCSHQNAYVSHTEIIRSETTPKQLLIGECEESCSYREDALKWRKQQDAKKQYMRKKRTEG